MRTNACGCRSCTRFLASLTWVQYLAWLRLTMGAVPTVLPPHEAQVRPAGESAYGADVEGVA